MRIQGNSILSKGDRLCLEQENNVRNARAFSADYAYKDLGKKDTLQGDGINFDPLWGSRTSLKASQFTLGGA